CARAGIHRLHGEVSELRDLRELLRLCLILPDVCHAVAIGDEENRIFYPNRTDVFGISPRWRNEIVSLEIDYPDRTILAAAIVATLFVPGVVHAISDASAVRGDLALVRARQNHWFFDAAFSGDSPE